jgi:hypothetical protein
VTRAEWKEDDEDSRSGLRRMTASLLFSDSKTRRRLSKMLLHCEVAPVWRETCTIPDQTVNRGGCGVNHTISGKQISSGV